MQKNKYKRIAVIAASFLLVFLPVLSAHAEENDQPEPQIMESVPSAEETTTPAEEPAVPAAEPAMPEIAVPAAELSPAEDPVNAADGFTEDLAVPDTAVLEDTALPAATNAVQMITDPAENAATPVPAAEESLPPSDDEEQQ